MLRMEKETYGATIYWMHKKKKEYIIHIVSGL